MTKDCDVALASASQTPDAHCSESKVNLMSEVCEDNVTVITVHIYITRYSDTLYIEAYTFIQVNIILCSSLFKSSQNTHMLI